MTKCRSWSSQPTRCISPCKINYINS